MTEKFADTDTGCPAAVDDNLDIGLILAGERR